MIFTEFEKLIVSTLFRAIDCYEKPYMPYHNKFLKEDPNDDKKIYGIETLLLIKQCEVYGEVCLTALYS